MNATRTTGDTQTLDRIFALAGLRLSARQLCKERLEQTQTFPSTLESNSGETIYLRQRVVGIIEDPLGTEEIG